MNETMLMHSLKTTRALPSHLASFRYRQRSELLDQRRKTHSFDIFHYKVLKSVRLSAIICRYQIRMSQLRQEEPLALEPGDDSGFRREVDCDHFDRDEALQADLAG